MIERATIEKVMTAQAITEKDTTGMGTIDMVMTYTAMTGMEIIRTAPAYIMKKRKVKNIMITENIKDGTRTKIKIETGMKMTTEPKTNMTEMTTKLNF
jgi:hypothetical protein